MHKKYSVNEVSKDVLDFIWPKLDHGGDESSTYKVQIMMARCASIDFETIVHAVVGLGLTLMGHDTDATLVAEHEVAIAARASRTREMYFVYQNIEGSSLVTNYSESLPLMPGCRSTRWLRLE